ncbi:hypothetical protein OG897_32425 [Streptomyces sp. NBC_00237]|uniref:hypothetical protein n=1 Tax=Streptomyces sp. NBC_00237 TaxID=2975687 RepID=UPI0022550DAE|nr:hypothetical protein [Streptomyces sp. NBC_00237]MCX5206105.1 hypothetical protein [Streptomyces sp. NBC_00237]
MTVSRPHHHPFAGPITVHGDSPPPLIFAVQTYEFAEAYRITPPPGTTSGVQIWRGTTVRTAVLHSMRTPPVGWPNHWTEFFPDGHLHWTAGVFPWTWDLPIWSAEPVAAPEWGAPCVRCGAFADEHTSHGFPWLYLRNGQSCFYGRYTAPTD